MSYQASVNLGTMRYFTINTVRVKPGHEAHFAERWRAIVAAHEKAKMDEHWAVYSVSAGAPNGTFLFIFARKSLAELDARRGAAHQRRVSRRHRRRGAREANLAMTREAVELDTTNHFAFSPKMSYVPKAWVDADPAFWTPPPPAPVVEEEAEDADCGLRIGIESWHPRSIDRIRTAIMTPTDCYWVEPGRLMAGEYPGDWTERSARRKLRALLDAGVRTFVDLTEQGELESVRGRGSPRRPGPPASRWPTTATPSATSTCRPPTACAPSST